MKRFWDKVNKTEHCWEWTGGKNTQGYGIFGFQGKIMKAHRVSWILTNGEIPMGTGVHGTCVLHKCDNPGCINPKHLFLGSNKDNMIDMQNKGRKVIQKNEHHPMCKLTDEQIKEIRITYATGKYTQRSLGDCFGITQVHIGRIINNKTRSNLTTQG